MGVKLSDIVPRSEIKIADLSGKIIAFDAYNMLYQFLASIRQEDGTPLLDFKGRVTAHLSGLFYRNAKLMEQGLKLVYVFDGTPPRFKQQEIEKRIEKKREAAIKLEIAKDHGLEELVKRYAEQTVHLTKEMVEESKQLLNAMGIPVVQAPSEGEAEAAYLCAKGVVHAAASQDYDSLLFGASRLVRHLSITRKRKVPGQNRWVKVEPEMIVLDEVLHTLNITREQLIIIGVLVGTDFNPGVKGIGPKRALKLVRTYDTWEKIRAEVEQKFNHTFPDYIDEVFEFFRSPPHSDTPPNICFDVLDPDKVKQILVDEHDFSEERVDAVCKRLLKQQKDQMAQCHLSDWFG